MKHNLKEIKEKIDCAMNLILTKDQILFETNSNERTISHKFSTYLAPKFPKWDVDCEYNRNMNEVKRLEKDGIDKRIYLDIIIHHRVSKENLLVIEVKKSPPYYILDKEVKEDLERLQKMTSDKKYNYDYGLFILFFVKEESDNSPILIYYKNGNQV